MTDRVKGCYVSFDKDIRIDDMQPIMDAIKMLKHVSDVRWQVADANDFVARSRVRHEVTDKLFRLIGEINDK